MIKVFGFKNFGIYIKPVYPISYRMSICAFDKDTAIKRIDDSEFLVRKMYQFEYELRLFKYIKRGYIFKIREVTEDLFSFESQGVEGINFSESSFRENIFIDFITLRARYYKEKAEWKYGKGNMIDKLIKRNTFLREQRAEYQAEINKELKENNKTLDEYRKSLNK